MLKPIFLKIFTSKNITTRPLYTNLISLNIWTLLSIVKYQLIQETEKFRPPPKIMPGSPYDIAPHEEHCCRVIANKSLHNSLSSRLVRWLLNSKYVEKL